MNINERRMDFKNWANGTVQHAGAIDKYIRCLDYDLPEKLDMDTIFSEDNLESLKSLRNRCGSRGDLHDWSMDIGNGDPMAAIGKYIVFLKLSKEELVSSSYPEKYNNIFKKFVDSLDINNAHLPQVGLKLETPVSKNNFYVYKNRQGTIYTKPIYGSSQFSQTSEKILRYLNGQKIRSDEDKSYIEPIGEYIKDTFLKKQSTLHTLNEDRIKNIILYGVPGVGKTYNTNKLIDLLENSDKSDYHIFDEIKTNSLNDGVDISTIQDRIKFITFHQSFGYEDFIEGFRPNESGNITLKDGVFKTICKEANEDTNHNYYLIIDEINRGNISKIFGELITLIEEDKRDNIEVTLPYSKEPFKIPKNLYIIGTMNSTDKSIALIDIALRRRFVFLQMEPNEDLVSNPDAKQLMQTLNNALGKEYRLGHSYFMSVKNSEDLEFVKEYKIKPLLEEYYYGDDNGLTKILEILE